VFLALVGCVFVGWVGLNDSWLEDEEGKEKLKQQMHMSEAERERGSDFLIDV